MIHTASATNTGPEKRFYVYQTCMHRNILPFVDFLTQTGNTADRKRGNNAKNKKGPQQHNGCCITVFLHYLYHHTNDLTLEKA
ncbi:MAG: hypothetical protein BGO09_15170 [Bacteroidetes bacterium 47-18]|nr:MAG: hypothetical protein BGO09_15170 [Bacteroidetes bacterium 47-18]